MSAPGAAGIDAGIEVCRRLHVLVAQQLPDQFVCSRVRVEDDFGREMPELMRCQLHSQKPMNSLHYRCGDCLLRPRLACPGDKDRIRALADDCRRNLITIGVETFGEHRRDLVFELDVSSKPNTTRAGLPRPCGQCRCSSKFKAARFSIRSGIWMRKSIAMAFCRSMNARPDVARFRRPRRQSASGSRMSPSSRRGSSNFRSRSYFSRSNLTAAFRACREASSRLLWSRREPSPIPQRSRSACGQYRGCRL